MGARMTVGIVVIVLVWTALAVPLGICIGKVIKFGMGS
jgi:hypothetical protein